ncbi:MAG: putative toxin-antitoxin system toxin component, PIN family [Gaiellales bacterium]
MRAVLDPNVLIAALLSPTGAPAQIVIRWLAGEFELVVSESLLEELARALAYPRLRSRISPEAATEFVAVVRQAADVAPQPPATAHHSPDPGDDYLLALAEAERAVLVSGDAHLLSLAGMLPITTTRAFLDTLTTDQAGGPT